MVRTTKAFPPFFFSFHEPSDPYGSWQCMSSLKWRWSFCTPQPASGQERKCTGADGSRPRSTRPRVERTGIGRYSPLFDNSCKELGTFGYNMTGGRPLCLLVNRWRFQSQVGTVFGSGGGDAESFNSWAAFWYSHDSGHIPPLSPKKTTARASVRMQSEGTHVFHFATRWRPGGGAYCCGGRGFV